MQAIHLDNHWLWRIGALDAAYDAPLLDDSAWHPLTALADTPHTEQYMWARAHFLMLPNDECSTWWLELTEPLPSGARVWVNYEEIVLAGRTREDITFAVAMDDNVVTLCLPMAALPTAWYKMACVPYPCG